MMPPPENDNDIQTDLDQRIDKMKAEHGLHTEKEQKAKNTNEGVKAGAELLTPIIVCLFIGLALDNWLDKSPLFLLIFFCLGVVTGFWNIYKLTK